MLLISIEVHKIDSINITILMIIITIVIIIILLVVCSLVLVIGDSAEGIIESF